MNMPAGTPSFPGFDQAVADALMKASSLGLPKFLGVEIVEFTPGRLVAELKVRDDFLTPFGNIHGGIMAGLVDHVLGCVLYPLMKRGQWAATTEFKINYLAPVRSGTVVAESTVIAFTKRTAVVRVEVSNDERLVCAAQGTLLIIDPQEGSG